MKEKDSITEAYMAMILEMPQLILTDTPENIAASAKMLRNHIAAEHKNSTKFDAENGYHHIKQGSSDIYYRHDGKHAKEISYISKNIQTGVEKGPDGDSKHIHNFLLHHLNNNDSVESSNSNTKGSKKLWIDFIKKNPNLNYHVHTRQNGEIIKKKLDSANIDKESSKIWGDDVKYRNSRIIVTK